MSHIIIDLKEDLKSIKREEDMRGYAEIRLTVGGDGEASQGLVKIAARTRPGGSGYVTLTFLVDVVGDERLTERTEKLMNMINNPDFAKLIKKGFSSLTPFETISDPGSNLYMGDVTFSFAKLAGQERAIVEEALFPALARALPMTFVETVWFD